MALNNDPLCPQCQTVMRGGVSEVAARQLGFRLETGHIRFTDETGQTQKRFLWQEPCWRCPACGGMFLPGFDLTDMRTRVQDHIQNLVARQQESPMEGWRVVLLHMRNLAAMLNSEEIDPVAARVLRDSVKRAFTRGHLRKFKYPALLVLCERALMFAEQHRAHRAAAQQDPKPERIGGDPWL